MSVRPGGTPVALTSTTGSPCRRKAAARPADRWMTSSRGCTAGTAMIPFCKSITTRAGLASRVVRAILLLFGDVICGAGARAPGLEFGVDVTAAPQQRRDRGQRGQARGHGEHHGQSVMERLGDQLGEELAAGDNPLGG